MHKFRQRILRRKALLAKEIISNDILQIGFKRALHPHVYSPWNGDTYSNDQKHSFLKFKINPRPQKQAEGKTRCKSRQSLPFQDQARICLKLANSVFYAAVM